MSLQSRLMVLVLAALLPIAFLQVYNELDLRRAREAEIHQQAQRLLGLVNAEHRRLVEGMREVLITLSETPGIRQTDGNACQGLMENLQKRFPDYLHIRVADRAGLIRCASAPEAIGVAIHDRPHFQQALDNEGFFIGEHIRARPNGIHALPLVLPYRNMAGEVAGTVSILIDLRWLTNYLSEKPLPFGAALTVADRSGTVLARIPEPPPEARVEHLPDHLRALLHGKSPRTVEMPDLDGTPRVLAYSPVDQGPTGLFVAIGIDKAAMMGSINEATSRSLLLFAVILATSLLAGWWTGNRFVRRPIAALIQATERWRAGDLGARTGLREDGSEIGVLGLAFDAMAGDLQDRAQGREEAHATALKMAQVLESTTDSIIEIDHEWRIIFVNRRAQMQVARGRDLIGMDFWDAFPEAVGTVFWTEYHRAMALQTPVEFETFSNRHDTWYAVRAFPSAEGLAIYFRDVTESRRIERAARQAEERVRAIVQTAVDAMIVIDEAGLIRSFNPAAERIFGYDAAEALGRNISLLMPEPYHSAHDGYIEAYRQTGIRKIIGIGREVEGRRKDGTIIPIELSIAEWHDGEKRYFTGILRDITERRLAQQEQRRLSEALEAERARLKAVLDQMPSGVSIAEVPSGRLLLHNDEAVRLLGDGAFRSDDLIGHTCWGAIHTDGTPYLATDYPLARALLHGEAVVQEEMTYRRRDGSVTVLEVNAAPVLDADGRMILAVSTFHDITGRKAMDEALRAAKDEAEKANQAKSRFLAAASHDLRQPLQSLFCFASALGGHVGDEAGREQLVQLERGLEALKSLLDSLLDMSRLDAGQIKPQIEDFPISVLLDHIDAGYAPVAADKGLDWHMVPSRATVRSDRTLLGRMLRNLVENALRYTEEGRVLVDCRPTASGLRIEVEDTGIGIAPENLEEIFTEFHQVGNPERDRQQGLGLGLAIVRRLSHLLGHPVEVRSRPGEGSVFSIEVPLAQTAVEPPPAPVQPAPTGNGRLAVLVDDDSIVLMGLQAIFENWGYEVILAHSPELALDQLKAQTRTPDLILADYRLRNGQVGTDAILQIRALYGARIPAVILTGETGPECKLDAMMHGLGIAQKPVTPRQLDKVINRQMELAV